LVVGMAVKANPREVWEETPAVNNHYKKMNYLVPSARAKGAVGDTGRYRSTRDRYGFPKGVAGSRGEGHTVAVMPVP
jgi:hypothetical protein